MKKYLLIYSIYFSFVFPNDSLSEIDSLNNRLVGADTYIEKCDIYLKLGILHHDLSNFNLALESYKKVLLYENRLISDPENHTLLYSTYNSIAQVYEEWGDWDKAKINYNKCYDYCNEENNLLTWPCTSIILSSSFLRAYPLSNEYLSIHYSEVISNLDKLIKSANENKDYADLSGALLIKSHILLENSHIDTTLEYDEIIKQIEQAVEICENMKFTDDSSSYEFRNKPLIKYLAYGYSLLGFVYENKNDFSNSVKYYRKAIVVRENLVDSDLTGLHKEYYHLARAYYNIDDYVNAIFYANESIGLIEPLLATTDKLKIQYFSNLIQSYYLIIDVYFMLDDYENGFKTIQKAKAKSLSSQISITNSEIPSLSEIEGSLAKDEAYIIYSKIGLEKFICMIITNDNIKHRIIEPLNLIDMRLQSLINLYLKQVSKPNVDNVFYIESSRKLYSILIEPIENNIENKKDIKFFLDGSLSYLPIETLIDSSGSFFIEKYNNISYFPSVSIKYKLEQRNYNFSKIEIIVFGDPLYDNNKIIDKDINTDNISATRRSIRYSINKSDELSGYYIQQGYNFPSLPYSNEEIQNVISLFPNSTYYNHKSFTEDKLKELSRDSLLLDFNIIHFATHGIIYPELPDLNALVLSQYDDLSLTEDGFLTKHEISQLNIKCDLTILSCCETAIGNIYDGEGVVNLSRSFFIAGSNAVITTLWPIFDESTSILMYNYYKYIKMEKDYSRSLVKIKKDFINGTYGEKYKHPSFWAPFVYYGK